MDEKTQRRIDEINASIPKQLRENIVETSVDEELLEQKERAEYALKKMQSGLGSVTGKVNANQREKTEKVIKDFLANTDFTKKVEKVNTKITERIDKYLDEAIRKEIKSGRMNPASKSDFNDFMRKMMRK